MDPERLVGRGRVIHDGKVVFESIGYTVEVRPREIVGRLHFDSPMQGFGLVTGQGPNSETYLELEDGRRWRCNVVNTEGRLSNRGGFGPAQ